MTSLDEIKAKGIAAFKKFKKIAAIPPPGPRVYDPRFKNVIDPGRDFLLLKKQKDIESSFDKRLSKHPDQQLNIDASTPRGKEVASAMYQDIINETSREKAAEHNRLFRKRPKQSGIDYRGM